MPTKCEELKSIGDSENDKSTSASSKSDEGSSDENYREFSEQEEP